MQATQANAAHATDTYLPTQSAEEIEIIGAREHNLHNLSLTLPRNKLIVITGVSGSGKSSLAFDTLYAEGQRRYIETFSAYIRQFIGSLERPNVDKVNGLSPVIAIDQKTTSRNPRSTVGTITEIYDFLRLLFARAADAYSYISGCKMEKLSDDEIIRRIQEQFDGKQIILCAPVVKGRKGHYREELEKIRKQGYTKARIDGDIVELEPKMSLDRFKIHDIETVIDKLEVGGGTTRLTQSVATALNIGKGSLLVLEAKTNTPHWYSRNLNDPESGISYDEPAPNNFSFNSPYGACPVCTGLGRVLNLEESVVVKDPHESIEKGTLAPLDEPYTTELGEALKVIARQLDAKLKTPWKDLPANFKKVVLYGDPDLNVSALPQAYPEQLFMGGKFIGIANYVRMRYLYAQSEQIRAGSEQFLKEDLCPECGGARLKKESLYFRVADKNIYDLARMDIAELATWFDNLLPRLSERQAKIATELVKEIHKRTGFLLDVGLDYLSLDRPAKSLSGGEAQRIRLATQIGSQLMGVLYILDEPSIGLHPRDNAKLIQSLKSLRDLDNSVIVVEHDKEMMLAADYILDIGPGAGVHGGRIVAQGTPDVFLQQGSPTADYLTGRRQIHIPAERRKPNGKKLVLKGATGHNLKNVTAEIPLGVFVCITGVSGSGKSSLINQTLYPLLHAHAYGFKRSTLPYEKIDGLQHIDKVIEIDQKPIGRTPRSNPATYTGVFTFIRELYAELPESKIRGYKPGRFSFNVKGGRCETCGGAGVQVIEMNFLPDVQVECPTCRGKRFNRETLEVRYKGKSISDVLGMTVEDAVLFFEAHPRIKVKLQALQDVGLGYITVGQPATTLSGGEAQRMKIATELGKRDSGQTFYILDEPTTGLHFQDIEKLLGTLQLLVEKGNTVLVIEHNLDVVKVADWVIDLGPEGGSGGGRIIATGTPEQIAAAKGSHTGRFLKVEL